jgi:hypothetical protein
MNSKEVLEQYTELKAAHPSLQLMNYPYKNILVLKGDWILDAQYNKTRMIGCYSISIFISTDYPKTLPKVYADNECVPNNFGHVNPDNTLCLGTTTELMVKFSKNPTLLYFVNEFVTSFFYSVAYFERYGIMPFGERAHGDAGIVEFYSELLHLSDSHDVIRWLHMMQLFHKNGDAPCLFCSGKSIRKCIHRHIFRNLDSIILERAVFDYISVMP